MLTTRRIKIVNGFRLKIHGYINDNFLDDEAMKMEDAIDVNRPLRLN